MGLRRLRGTEEWAAAARLAQNNDEWDIEGDFMDVKKLAGALLAFALAIPIIATAPPETLALVDVGLIGVLYLLRRRRLTSADARNARGSRPCSR